MSLRHSTFLAAFLACTTVLHAVRPAPAEAPAKSEPVKAETPAATEPVPPYVLKNRSTFADPTTVTRAPFWPIGWVKPKAGVVVQAQQVQAPKMVLDASSFKVTSILLGAGTTPSLAVINGRAYSEGEFLRIPKTPGTVAPRIRIHRINDGTVILQNAEQMLVAPLQRPELGARKPEELLDDKDR